MIRRRTRQTWNTQALLGVISIAGAVALLLVVRPWERSSAPEPTSATKTTAVQSDRPTRTFDGAASGLRSTTVVPTLDASLEAGRSVVWCASFLQAWQTLGREVVKGPVVVRGAEALSDRLNAAPTLDLPREACWTWVGPAGPGGRAEAQRSYARWRPNGESPGLPAGDDGAVVLAALEAAVPFARGFNAADRPLVFRDAVGTEAGVRAFGLRERDDYDYRAIRKQVRVLHAGWAGERNASLYEMVLDPDRTSSPYQIVLACVEPGTTLRETWLRVLSILREPTWKGVHDRLTYADTLLVPEMSWRIVHRFRELEGPERVLGDTTAWLAAAQQEITFRLDRSGATVSSATSLRASGAPGRYEFDRPFLVIVKPRNRDTPFFMMWVGSAELLTPFARGGE